MRNAYRRTPEWGTPASAPIEGKRYRVWSDRYLQSTSGRRRAEQLRLLLERSRKDERRTWETAFLDSLVPIVPKRIATEDLSDFIEDICHRASRGEHPLRTSVRILVAAFWTVVNSIQYRFTDFRRHKGV